jgi:hypothetical protein
VRADTIGNPLTTAEQTTSGRTGRLRKCIRERPSIMNGRKTDLGRRVWFRSSRVFSSDGRWYFHTREGVDVGPYETQFEAEVEAGMLKELLQEPEPSQSSREVIRDFVIESYGMGRPLNPTFKDTG